VHGCASNIVQNRIGAPSVGLDGDKHLYAEPEHAITTDITDFGPDSSFDLLEHPRYRLFQD